MDASDGASTISRMGLVTRQKQRPIPPSPKQLVLKDGEDPCDESQEWRAFYDGVGDIRGQNQGCPGRGGG